MTLRGGNKAKKELVFYQSHGWNMFDFGVLTDIVKLYLEREVNALDFIFEKYGFHGLVELGCGYGRMLDWTIDKKANYYGVEIVKWLFELADVRIKLKSKDSDLHLSAHHLCASHIHLVLNQLKNNHKQDALGKSLVFFPFNLVGNISDLDQTFSTIRKYNIPVLLSCFDDSELATKARAEYYNLCRYKNIKYNKTDQGDFFTSDEGLNTVAFSKKYLGEFLKKHNFIIEETIPLLDGIATGYLLGRPELRLKQSTTERRLFPRHSLNRIKGILTYIDNKSKEYALQNMTTKIIEIVDISTFGANLVIKDAQEIEPGVAGKIDFLDASGSVSIDTAVIKIISSEKIGNNLNLRVEFNSAFDVEKYLMNFR